MKRAGNCPFTQKIEGGDLKKKKRYIHVLTFFATANTTGGEKKSITHALGPRGNDDRPRPPVSERPTARVLRQKRWYRNSRVSSEGTLARGEGGGGGSGGGGGGGGGAAGGAAGGVRL